jgi:hypothetical protein
MSWAELIAKSFRVWRITLSSVLVFSFAAALLRYGGILLFSKNPGISPVVGSIIIAIILLVPTNAIFARIYYILKEKPISLSQSLAVALLRFPQTVVWLIAVMLAMYVPVTLLMYAMDHFSPSLAGIFVGVFLFYVIVLTSIAIYCIFVFPLIINESYSVISAVKRSIALVKGEWWLTGLIMSVPAFFSVIVQLMGKILLGELGIMISLALFMSLNMSTVLTLYEYHLAREAQNKIQQ